MFWALCYFYMSTMLSWRACEWRVGWGARTMAYELLSRPNCLNWVMLPGRQFCITNRQCDACLSPCRIRVVWGCGAMKIRWVGWARAMKNWWVRRCRGDVHGCPRFFPMPVGLLFGDISMYPHYTKNRPMSRHNLRLPPWRNIAGICIGFELEEHIWIQNGGGPSITVFFFSDFAHRVRWLFGDEWTIAESRSTSDFVL